MALLGCVKGFPPRGTEPLRELPGPLLMLATARLLHVSAFGGKADIARPCPHVRF